MLQRAASVQPSLPRAGSGAIRVLMCLQPSAQVGGLETSFGRLASALEDAGLTTDVAVLGSNASTSATAGYLSSLMTVHTPRGIRQTTRLVRDYDVVHVHSNSGTTSWPATAVFAAIVTRRRLVVSLHLPGIPEPRPRLRGRVRARMLALPRQLLLAVSADAVTSPSLAAAAVAAEKFAPLGVRVVPLWNGVPDTGVIDFPADRSLRLVFVGRLSEHKRPLDFVDAVALAARRGADVLADIVGDGPLRDSVERRIAASGAADRFTMHGSVPDPLRVLGRGHLLVLMSRHEGGPMVVMEAGAIGRGTIARAGLEGVEEDWPEAVAVVPRDGGPAEFAELFCALAADPLRTQLLGAAARLRYENFFTSAAAAGRLRAVYGRARPRAGEQPC